MNEHVMIINRKSRYHLMTGTLVEIKGEFAKVLFERKDMKETIVFLIQELGYI